MYLFQRNRLIHFPHGRGSLLFTFQRSRGRYLAVIAGWLTVRLEAKKNRGIQEVSYYGMKTLRQTSAVAVAQPWGKAAQEESIHITFINGEIIVGDPHLSSNFLLIKSNVVIWRFVVRRV